MGTVKWFDGVKGFGFIAPDAGDKDLFVHQTSIRSDGFRTLAEGDAVEHGDDGLSKAVDVTGPHGSTISSYDGGGGREYSGGRGRGSRGYSGGGYGGGYGGGGGGGGYERGWRSGGRGGRMGGGGGYGGRQKVSFDLLASDSSSDDGSLSLRSASDSFLSNDGEDGRSTHWKRKSKASNKRKLAKRAVVAGDPGLLGLLVGLDHQTPSLNETGHCEDGMGFGVSENRSVVERHRKAPK